MRNWRPVDLRFCARNQSDSPIRWGFCRGACTQSCRLPISWSGSLRPTASRTLSTKACRRFCRGNRIASMCRRRWRFLLGRGKIERWAGRLQENQRMKMTPLCLWNSYCSFSEESSSVLSKTGKERLRGVWDLVDSWRRGNNSVTSLYRRWNFLVTSLGFWCRGYNCNFDLW